MILFKREVLVDRNRAYTRAFLLILRIVVDLSDWMVVNAGLELQAPFSSNISGFAGAVRTIQAKSGLGRISSPTIRLIPPKLILGGSTGVVEAGALLDQEIRLEKSNGNPG